MQWRYALRSRRSLSAGLTALLLLSITGTQLAQAEASRHENRSSVRAASSPTPTISVPTVEIPDSTPLPVPTLTLPQPRPHHRAHPRPQKHHHPIKRHEQVRHVQWMWAFLTSYCPGTAGWVSASGYQVFYGMLANNYYSFGTRVTIPVLGMTGVVEDRFGGWRPSNDFDVWSPVCYSTPTGWFKVGIVD